MLILILFLTILLFPPETHAHPGKTDYQGGHRCLKECAEWDLYYGEYHLHDKEGRPVRVQGKKRLRKVPGKAAAEPVAEPVSEATVTQVASAISRPIVSPAIPEEEPCLPALPGGLLALLLLWLWMRRRMARR
ncbi:MAG: YHYH domain-containing protein [Nitrospirota bacterium]|nr:YHYH domain-containing protein [Nitrospirota bacterium]